MRRCGSREVAEELTSETFLAAVDPVRRSAPPRIDIAWLIGVARHKLADHWRRQVREQRNLRAVASDPTPDAAEDDPWDCRLDVLRTREVLDRIAPQRCSSERVASSDSPTPTERGIR